MPGLKHLKGVKSQKTQRMYEHVKEQYLRSGKPVKKAKELAARTALKYRKKEGLK